MEIENSIIPRHLMTRAINTAIRSSGCSLEKKPGRGRSSTWIVRNGDARQLASFRTTQNRWFAFPPLDGGKGWKTLDDVDVVYVAALNDSVPKEIEVYSFPADEVRDSFNAAYKARGNAGHTIKDGFGIWVALDATNNSAPTSVGSGLATKYPPMATYTIESLSVDESLETDADGDDDTVEPTAATSSDSKPAEPLKLTIAEAKQALALTFGVSPDSIKITIEG